MWRGGGGGRHGATERLAEGPDGNGAAAGEDAKADVTADVEQVKRLKDEVEVEVEVAVEEERPAATAAASLRTRLVQHCRGRSDLYDVCFSSDDRCSRGQLGACQVMLLVDGGNGGWDGAWRWALGSGCTLVHVGQCLPPLPELEAWVHFVPAAADLSDLDERVRWALKEPEAVLVAQRCRELYDALRAPGRASRALVALFAELARDGCSAR